MVHACNSGTQDAEVGQPKFKASQDYIIRTNLKGKEEKKYCLLSVWAMVSNISSTTNPQMLFQSPRCSQPLQQERGKFSSLGAAALGEPLTAVGSM